MNVLKFTTAGSVDDGKSTLIGRLLLDTNSLTTDQLDAINKASAKKGSAEPDLSLATDGLIAEREQGITIDVAHIYFTTLKRKFIIADTPGHVEYTRNMITGASNSQAALILIDARNGIIEQTKRHLYITSLLRIKEVVVCINKMDLVNYNENVYYQIAADVKKYADGLTFHEFNFRYIPISAKLGDHVVKPSTNMPWYQQEPLLTYLENLNVSSEDNHPARFAVQYVIRTDHSEKRDYRAYAGILYSGTLKAGDRVTALPNGRSSVIKAIERYTEQPDVACAGESISILLEDDIDISRGNFIVPSDLQPEARKEFQAMICWLNNSPLQPGSKYILQHGIYKTPVKIDQISRILDPETLEYSDQNHLVGLNAIADVHVRSANPVYADSFASNKSNGAFILIDPQTNNTVGVGFVN